MAPVAVVERQATHDASRSTCNRAMRVGEDVKFGRSGDEWGRLATTGKQFLIERARMRRTTSYTEFNAALVNRTGARGFDFDLDSDRAVVGALLGEISEEATRENGGVLISALVQYLDANDAGPSFLV